MAKKTIDPQTEPATAAPPPAVGRQHPSAAPLCPVHQRRMESKGSTGRATKYYCPEEGCNFSAHIERPMACPFHQDVLLVQIPQRDSPGTYFVFWRCPWRDRETGEQCAYVQKQPKPALGKRLDAEQQEDFSAR